MAILYHITYRNSWNFAKLRENYTSDSLEKEGFIHCCNLDQLLDVANYYYKGEKDLVILLIDSQQLKSELRHEALTTPDPYPHIYGPLNLDAVIQVLDFPTNPDGKFSLPSKLKR